ncbi:MAG: peptidylprolyl isomerase [Candidatus Krumholzibacteria bacterium]|nr:peptidylprolyl isomerase [Candidatus Krumholzibacteria bacterium]MDH4337272.1 peptidylprolyl isomerase [Candidatus Krumholzibacteria bacterium]MDH5270015.1 peptidylprolyl isomerase [Candidatus Krumholzibacteria bacterium]MDH5627131.1 peptidylprolyl isomerase [Candidatus Krumholzibacteria bacterium]
MRAIRILLPLSLLAAGLVAGGCSRSDEKTSLDVPEDQLAATVEDWQLSRAQLEEFLRRLPEPQRRRFDTPQGRAELALRLMQEEMSYLEAQRLKLDDDEAVRKQIEDATRTILVSEYLREYVDSKARPTDEEMHAYYETHSDQFTVLATIRAQHVFSKNKEKLEEIKVRVEEGGEKFTTMAHLYSEDTITKADGGDLGYFNPGGYIRGVGYSQTFTDALEQMEPGKIYGPIKWEQGYSLVRVNDREDARLRPYDEVKEEIASQLSRDKLEQTRQTHFAEVQTRYQAHNYMQESYDSTQRGPEELFQFAQNSEDPQNRINAFQEIVDKFPDDPHAPHAMFMIGFVYAEEMKDFVMADRTFNRLIQDYPDSEMAETARWMLQNLDKPLPKFEDLDDLNRQIEDQSH